MLCYVMHFDFLGVLKCDDQKDSAGPFSYNALQSENDNVFKITNNRKGISDLLPLQLFIIGEFFCGLQGVARPLKSSGIPLKRSASVICYQNGYDFWHFCHDLLWWRWVHPSKIMHKPPCKTRTNPPLFHQRVLFSPSMFKHSFLLLAKECRYIIDCPPPFSLRSISQFGFATAHPNTVTCSASG